MSARHLLPTMGVGSYASPGWFIAFQQKIRDGSAGASDIREALDDATRIAVLDQIEAGVDILTDGELRRQRFVYEMFDRIEGLERIKPGRKIDKASWYHGDTTYRPTGNLSGVCPAGI